MKRDVAEMKAARQHCKCHNVWLQLFIKSIAERKRLNYQSHIYYPFATDVP